MSSAPNNITRLPTANVTAIETRDALTKEERARANELAVNDDREMLPQRDDEARRELALEGADDETFSLVPMPQPDHNWSYMLISFGIVVLLPLCLLGMYFLFLATPQYFAEFRFSVTEVTPSAGPLGGGASGGTTASAVASAMGGHGAAVGGGSAQNFVVIDYLKSRQVVDELSQTVDVREIYSRPEIDWPNRFDRSRSTEHLVRYWNKMVWANYDPLTGLASVEIKAFRPDDALTIANQLVTLSETLVNKIAKRAEEDAVKFAEQEVVRAKASLDKARAAMAEFREKEGVIDPIPSVVSGNTSSSAPCADRCHSSRRITTRSADRISARRPPRSWLSSPASRRRASSWPPSSAKSPAAAPAAMSWRASSPGSSHSIWIGNMRRRSCSRRCNPSTVHGPTQPPSIFISRLTFAQHYPKVQAARASSCR